MILSPRGNKKDAHLAASLDDAHNIELGEADAVGAAACDRAAMATKNNEEEMNVGRMICGNILMLVMVEDAETTLEEPCKRCRVAALALPHAAIPILATCARFMLL